MKTKPTSTETDGGGGSASPTDSIHPRDHVPKRHDESEQDAHKRWLKNATYYARLAEELNDIAQNGTLDDLQEWLTHHDIAMWFIRHSIVDALESASQTCHNVGYALFDHDETQPPQWMRQAIQAKMDAGDFHEQDKLEKVLLLNHVKSEDGHGQETAYLKAMINGEWWRVTIQGDDAVSTVKMTRNIDREASQ